MATVPDPTKRLCARYAALLRRLTLMDDDDIFLPESCTLGLPLFLLEPPRPAQPILALRVMRLRTPVVGVFLHCVCPGPVVAGVVVRPLLDAGSFNMAMCSSIKMQMAAASDAYKARASPLATNPTTEQPTHPPTHPETENQNKNH